MAIGALVVAALAPTAHAASGPYLVKDINPTGPARPHELTDLNGVLLFGASDGVRGVELWRSDGTSDGTRRVKDIRPGSRSSRPLGLTAVGGLVYFSADDGDHGRELWVSDGTRAGTRLVRDLRVGPAASNPQDFASIDGLVYFSADDGASGVDLWVSDGTAAGTHRVKDLPLNGPDAWLGWLTALGSRLFFTAYDPGTGVVTMYTSDGTAAGTSRFRDSAGRLIRGSIYPVQVVGARMYFGYNGDLWRSAGAPASTRRISYVDVSDGPIVGIGQTAFFSSGTALWATEGTVASNRKLADLRFSFMRAANDHVIVFPFDDGPWTTDGTVAGTVPAGKHVETDDQPGALNGIVYFNGYGYEDAYAATPSSAGNASGSFTPAPYGDLWRTDGTAGGTYSVGGPSGYMGEFEDSGGKLFFAIATNPWSTTSEVELYAYIP